MLVAVSLCLPVQLTEHIAVQSVFRAKIPLFIPEPMLAWVAAIESLATGCFQNLSFQQTL
jgi:hypothetical protein